jgi:hypothetical protein
MTEPVRHVLVITRYPAQPIILELDGKPVRYVTGKFTPDVTRIVYEEGEDQ